MISNYAILATTYKLTSEQLRYPFSYQDFLNHLKKIAQLQMHKMNSVSVSVKWWECFVAAIRSSRDALYFDRELKIDGNHLIFNFTHVYTRVSAQWFEQYREPAPAKTYIKEVLQSDKAFVKVKPSVRFNSKINTSGYVMDITELKAGEDILDIHQLKGDLPDPT